MGELIGDPALGLRGGLVSGALMVVFVLAGPSSAAPRGLALAWAGGPRPQTVDTRTIAPARFARSGSSSSPSPGLSFRVIIPFLTTGSSVTSSLYQPV